MSKTLPGKPEDVEHSAEFYVDLIDGYRHTLRAERGHRRGDAEIIIRWMRDIIDVFAGCDEYKFGRPAHAKELIIERAEDVIARLKKVPSTGQ